MIIDIVAPAGCSESVEITGDGEDVVLLVTSKEEGFPEEDSAASVSMQPNEARAVAHALLANAALCERDLRIGPPTREPAG